MAFRAAEYDRYTGPRSKRPAWWPLMSATLLRGWSSKWVRRLTWLSLIQGFSLCVLMYVLNDVIPTWRETAQMVGNSVQMQDEFTIDARLYLRLLNLFVYPVLMPLALLFGYDLISKDIETNATEAYFARPITPLSYLMGRTLAFIGFLLAATLGPMLMVWVADYATSADGHFETIKAVPGGMTLALAFIATSLALLVQAVSILTRSGTWTNLIFLMVFLFGHAMAYILYEMTDNLNMLSMSILHNTFVICAAALGELDRFDDHAPAALSFMVMGIAAAASFLILLRGLGRRSMLG
jgi:hypothetical protein